MYELKLLKKGILEEFQSDVLSIPWKIRRKILEPLEELYEDDPEATLEDVYKALFYQVYGDRSIYIHDTLPVTIFKRLKIYREEWVNRDINN